MPKTIRPSEIGPRIEEHLGEDRAQDLLRSIEGGGASRASVERFGRTIALRNPNSDRDNQVFCLTHEGLGYLPKILDFYEGQDTQPSFYLTPFGFSGDLGRGLLEAGVYPTSCGQALLFGYPEKEQIEAPPGITIEAATPDNMDDFLKTMADGFDWHSDWREGVKDYERRKLIELDSYKGFLARVDGEPVGTGTLSIDGDFVFLRQGTVLPGFRERGCHAALLHARLHAAHRLGCYAVGSGAAYNSASFRNQLRAGLQLAYIELSWKRQ